MIAFSQLTLFDVMNLVRGDYHIGKYSVYSFNRWYSGYLSINFRLLHGSCLSCDQRIRFHSKEEAQTQISPSKRPHDLYPRNSFFSISHLTMHNLPDHDRTDSSCCWDTNLRQIFPEERSNGAQGNIVVPRFNVEKGIQTRTKVSRTCFGSSQKKDHWCERKMDQGRLKTR